MGLLGGRICRRTGDDPIARSAVPIARPPATASATSPAAARTVAVFGPLMRATILTGAVVTTLLGVAVRPRVRECGFTWFNGIVVAMAAALVG